MPCGSAIGCVVKGGLIAPGGVRWPVGVVGISVVAGLLGAYNIELDPIY